MILPGYFIVKNFREKVYTALKWNVPFSGISEESHVPHFFEYIPYPNISQKGYPPFFFSISDIPNFQEKVSSFIWVLIFFLRCNVVQFCNVSIPKSNFIINWSEGHFLFCFSKNRYFNNFSYVRAFGIQTRSLNEKVVNFIVLKHQNSNYTVDLKMMISPTSGII